MIPQQSEAGFPTPEAARADDAKGRWRNRFRPVRPRLTIAQVLAWADAHYARTGKWPTIKSGAVAEELTGALEGDLRSSELRISWFSGRIFAAKAACRSARRA